MNKTIASCVALTTDKLTNLELATLNNYVNGFGKLPLDHVLYPRVAHLLNQNGTAHSEVKDALAQIVLIRIGGMNGQS
jgi:hypothetical protein